MSGPGRPTRSRATTSGAADQGAGPRERSRPRRPERRPTSERSQDPESGRLTRRATERAGQVLRCGHRTRDRIYGARREPRPAGNVWEGSRKRTVTGMYTGDPQVTIQCVVLLCEVTRSRCVVAVRELYGRLCVGGSGGLRDDVRSGERRSGRSLQIRLIRSVSCPERLQEAPLTGPPGIQRAIVADPSHRPALIFRL